MAYDEDLAERLRLLLAETAGVSERKMFGGLAFLVDRHMAIVASGQGGIMARVHPDDAEQVMASTSARLAEMGGKQMKGWIRVAPEDVKTDEALQPWIDRAVAFTATLPPKS